MALLCIYLNLTHLIKFDWLIGAFANGALRNISLLVLCFRLYCYCLFCHFLMDTDLCCATGPPVQHTLWAIKLGLLGEEARGVVRKLEVLTPLGGCIENSLIRSHCRRLGLVLIWRPLLLSACKRNNNSNDNACSEFRLTKLSIITAFVLLLCSCETDVLPMSRLIPLAHAKETCTRNLHQKLVLIHVT